MTPGVTPFGTRESLTFFGSEITSALKCAAAVAVEIVAADETAGAAGGGVVSSDDDMEVGRADSEWR